MVVSLSCSSSLVTLSYLLLISSISNCWASGERGGERRRRVGMSLEIYFLYFVPSKCAFISVAFFPSCRNLVSSSTFCLKKGKSLTSFSSLPLSNPLLFLPYLSTLASTIFSYCFFKEDKTSSFSFSSCCNEMLFSLSKLAALHAKKSHKNKILQYTCICSQVLYMYMHGVMSLSPSPPPLPPLSLLIQF